VTPAPLHRPNKVNAKHAGKAASNPSQFYLAVATTSTYHISHIVHTNINRSCEVVFANEKFSAVLIENAIASMMTLLLLTLYSSSALEQAAVGASGDVLAGAASDEEFDELRANEADHERESAEACEVFYCGGASAALPQMSRYALGHGPLVDVIGGAGEAGLSIYVTEAPLFSAEECDRVVALAEAEGAGLPSTKSGKYQIGKAWVKEMPGVLDWFNGALEQKLFPALAELFPTFVSAPGTLRAHSVAILKYNASHPATDIHIDDALLAFTIALSPSSGFEGGGTYFESLGTVLPMEQGMVTFRPGAVRHAGHSVTSGLR